MKKVVGVIFGGLTALAGVVCMFKPVQTYIQIGWILGALLIIHGVERIVKNVEEGKKDLKDVVFRIVEVIAGALIFGSTILRILTDIIIVYVASAGVMLFGLYFIINGIKNSENNRRRVIKAVVGLLIIGIGVVLWTNPLDMVICIVYTVATALALQGVDIIMISLVGRKEAFKES